MWERHVCLCWLAASFWVFLSSLTNSVLKSDRVQTCRIIADNEKGWPKPSVHILNIISMQPKQRQIDYKGCHRFRINNRRGSGAVTEQREDWQSLIALLCINHIFIFMHKLFQRAKSCAFTQALQLHIHACNKSHTKLWHIYPAPYIDTNWNDLRCHFHKLCLCLLHLLSSPPLFCSSAKSWCQCTNTGLAKFPSAAG